MSITWCLSSRAQLRDGTEASLRPISPADAPALDRLFRELSPESRYQRFGPTNALSAPMLLYLTDVDGERHVAVGAWLPAHDGERLVGVGRFVRSDVDPRAAEAAITVVDDVHHKGLGTQLLKALVEAARHAGLARLTFEVRRANVAARGLIRQEGGQVVQDRGTELTFELHVPPLALLLLPLRIAIAQVTRWRDLLASL